MSVAEGPSGGSNNPQEVVVWFQHGVSAYDSETGRNLWKKIDNFYTAIRGQYVTAGVSESTDDNGRLQGYDVRTGRRLWTLGVPPTRKQGCLGTGDPGSNFVVDTVEWLFSGDCAEAHDVITGRSVTVSRYPRHWRGIPVGTPNRILAFDGKRLGLFPTTNLSRPVWSVAAQQTEPLALSTGHVLVRAPSGLVVLSAKDGSITRHVNKGQFPPDNQVSSAIEPTAVDGLLLSQLENGNVAVLELDPPKL